jgi:hypothetical protein
MVDGKGDYCLGCLAYGADGVPFVYRSMILGSTVTCQSACLESNPRHVPLCMYAGTGMMNQVLLADRRSTRLFGRQFLSVLTPSLATLYIKYIMKGARFITLSVHT